MRHAKSRSGGVGVTGLLTNYNAYQRWVRTTHARSQYADVTFQMAGLKKEDSSKTKHRDLTDAEIRKSEKTVQQALAAFRCFTNPFDVEIKELLVVLSSGAVVPENIASDILHAEKAGQKAREEFVAARLETGKDFFQPVKSLKLKSFEDINKKVKLNAAQNRMMQYKEQSNSAFYFLVQSQQQGIQLDLKDLMAYPLTTIPYSIGLPGHFLVKTDKSKALHKLCENKESFPLPPITETLTIVDGNVLFYCLTEVPGNFRQICRKIFNMLPDGDCVFSTDTYKEVSVKSTERRRRGVSEKLIIGGPSTKKPADWKAFLANDENKNQLIDLLLAQWSTEEYAADMSGKELTFFAHGKAYLLSSTDGKNVTVTEIVDLHSEQEETDTRIILYIEYAERQGHKYARVKSPDSDILFLLLHYARSFQDIVVLFDTGTGNKRQIVNITDMAQEYTQTHCTALLALHAFTGCDTTSALKGHGKVKPLKIIQKSPEYEHSLSQLGVDWSVSEQLHQKLEEFTCAVYGKPRLRDVNVVRYTKINDVCSKGGVESLKNVDMSSLPPCKKTLREHVNRVNYQVAIWRSAHQPNPDIPDPEQHGWRLVHGHLQPVWFQGEDIPAQLADVRLQTGDDSEDDDDNVEDVDDVNSDLDVSDNDED